ncbi:MAG TPA: hypothetical protein VN493_09665 [Thermoanaerobaculia bacterium]|nr:hypothetical protein [Thermoanaerobaculia bacterium]
MIRKPILRLALVLVLALALAGPARAAGPEPPSFGKVPQVITATWAWFQALWSGADHGCDIDPNGKPRCGPVMPRLDAGCDIDPDGKPRCAPQGM